MQSNRLMMMLSLHDALPILKPQHVQHVGPLDRLLAAAEAAHAELLDAARQERVGAAHADFGAELQEAPDVRAGDARSEEHTSELQSHSDLVCSLLLDIKKSK